MQGQVIAQLWVKRDRENIPLANRNRMAIDFGQNVHAIPDFLNPRSSDEHGIEGGSVEGQLSFERRKLTPEGVSAYGDVEDAEMLPVQHDHSCTGAEDRPSLSDEVDEWTCETLSLHSQADGRRLSARDDEGIEALEILRGADLARLDA